jgi:O-acetyl-ADP-ribose deacetylase (regulator of RNase III)
MHQTGTCPTTPPTPLQITQGDATRPVGGGARIIAHICNDEGRWGRGFVVAVSRRWEAPERHYRSWHRGHNGQRLPLGEVQLVEVDSRLWVANMIAQRGIAPEAGRPPIRYDVLALCLRQLANHAIERAASVHMPRIGCGLAGGHWARIEPIVCEQLCARGVSVTVYDLPGRGGWEN